MTDRPEREVEGLQVDFGSPKRLAAWADTLDKDAIEHNTERPWPVVGHSTLSASSLPLDLRAAADALRTLQAENEEAMKQWRHWQEEAFRLRKASDGWHKLEAENERLRELVGAYKLGHSKCTEPWNSCSTCKRADRALEPETEE